MASIDQAAVVGEFCAITEASPETVGLAPPLLLLPTLPLFIISPLITLPYLFLGYDLSGRP